MISIEETADATMALLANLSTISLSQKNTLGWDNLPDIHLGLVILGPDAFKNKKADSMLSLIFNKFDNQCLDDKGEKSISSTVLDWAKVCCRTKKVTQAEGTAMWYLYTKTNEIVCVGLTVHIQQLTHRWTPPKHRGKGYATELLRRLGWIYSNTIGCPFWVCSYNRMDTINRRAGFEPFTHPNRDGTQDYTLPGSLWDRYAILNGSQYKIEEGYAREEDDKRVVMDWLSIIIWACETKAKAAEQFSKMKIKA
jgi:hypothetical protein